MRSLKIVIVGEEFVGKTSLVNQFIDNKFSYAQIKLPHSECQHKTVSVQNIDVNLELWEVITDKRRYQTGSIYKRADAILLVYDVNDPNSFKQLIKWNNEVDRYAFDFPMKFIIGNKNDKRKDAPTPRRRSYTVQQPTQCNNEHNYHSPLVSQGISIPSGKHKASRSNSGGKKKAPQIDNSIMVSTSLPTPSVARAYLTSLPAPKSIKRAASSVAVTRTRESNIRSNSAIDITSRHSSNKKTQEEEEEETENITITTNNVGVGVDSEDVERFAKAINGTVIQLSAADHASVCQCFLGIASCLISKSAGVKQTGPQIAYTIPSKRESCIIS